jgi:hypothetical protein
MPRKMVFVIKKIFSFAKTMVLVMQTLFRTTEIMVTAAQEWSKGGSLFFTL